MRHGLTLACGLGLMLGCGEGVSVPVGTSVVVGVAPLSLPGLAKVCYDLRVANGAGGLGDIVWSRGTPGLNGGVGDPGALCSDRFGSGAGGDLSYVGPCDADGPGGTRTNSVTLWLDGLYGEGGTYLAPSQGWSNPCATGCTLDMVCQESADVSVTFDLTILRQADQGFFDVAVTFDDIFCSAKLDCLEPLLFLPGTSLRDTTAVLAFACTAGTDSDTILLRDPITVTCGTEVTVIDPAAGRGNLYGVDPEPDDAVWQAAVYAGQETLSCGAAPCNKLYWNVALGFDAATAGCRVSTRATAGPIAALSEGQTPEATTWPVITWDHALTGPTGGLACASHPLNGAPAGVATSYTAVDSPATFASSFDGITLSTFETTSAFITDGLLLHLDAGDPSSYPGAGSTWTDLSGFARHGNLIGSPTFSTEGGGAIVLNGLNQHVEAGTVEPAQMTLTAWFRATGVPTNNDAFGATLITNSPQLHLGTVQYALSYSWADQRLAFTVHGNTQAVVTPNDTVLRNSVYHAAATYDGATRRLYVNGVLIAESPWATAPIYPTSGNRNVQIGHWGYPGYSRQFNGLIHEVAIYGRALTAAEVQQNYDATRGRFGL
jgi:hypothetical protein